MTYHKNLVVVGRPKMSLDLELNLSPSYSPPKTSTKIDESINHRETVSPSNGNNLTSPSKKTTLSWLSFDGGNDVDHKDQEMVTKVCMKCHMLVMLSTPTPVCPNCKFMHPRDHSSTRLFKPPNLLRLLCQALQSFWILMCVRNSMSCIYTTSTKTFIPYAFMKDISFLFVYA